MIEHYDWRVGWTAIAAISATLALVGALLVRETPEVLGQRRDGVEPGAHAGGAGEQMASVADRWTAAQAIRTPQFGLMLGCGVAYAVPWNTVVPHLTLHMLDLGYPEEVAIGFVGTMALISIGGRLVGAVGDWIPPQYSLSVALALEGLVSGGLLMAADPMIANVSIALIAVGFGAAYISIPVVFSHFFGRRAFSVTTGIRMTITGVFSGLGPWLAGLAFDANGSYTIPFVGLMAVGLAGAAAAAAMRHPGTPAAAA